MRTELLLQEIEDLKHENHFWRNNAEKNRKEAEEHAEQISHAKQKIRHLEYENDRLRRVISYHLQNLDLLWYALKTDLEEDLENGDSQT